MKQGALLLTALLLIAPLAAGGPGHTANDSAPVDLFLHPASGNTFVLSALPPTEDAVQAVPAPDLRCTVVAGSLGSEAVMYATFTTAMVSGVPASFSGGELLPRVLDVDKTKTFKLHLSLESVLGGQAYAGPVPQVVVSAALIPGAPGGGAGPIASGDTGVMVLSSQSQSNNARYHEVDGRYVYDLQIGLAAAALPLIEGGNGMHVEIRIWNDNPLCSSNDFTLPLLQFYSDAEHRSFLDLSPYDPVLVGVPYVDSDDHETRISAVVSSPMGILDVPESGLVLELRGQAQFNSIERQPIDYSAAAQAKEINVTWVWSHHADGAPNGSYGVTVYASNLKGSFTKDNSSTFRIGAIPGSNVTIEAPPAPEKKSPGPGALTIVVLAAAVAIVRRATRP